MRLIPALCEQADEVRGLDTRRAFHRDRLVYRQEQVDQGLAEAAQRAEHEWQRATAKLAAQRLTLARRYGGQEWQRLGALLEAMAGEQ